MRRIRLLACLAGLLAFLLPMIPARRAGADDCDATFQAAMVALKEAEKTGSVPAARKAAELLDQCEARCPDNSWYPMYGGIARVLGRDYYGAEAAAGRLRAQLLDRAHELNRSEAAVEGDPKVLFLRATISLYLGNQAEAAVGNLERARARDPGFLREQLSVLLFHARLKFAKDLTERQSWEKAIAQTLLAKRETIGDPDTTRLDIALRNLGQLYKLADQYPASQKVWEELLQRDPDNVAIRYGLAGTYAAQFMYDRAIEQWKHVLRLVDAGKVPPEDAPQIEDARLRYGNCLWQSGRTEDGRKELLAFHEKHPDDARPSYWLATLEWEQATNVQKAIEWAERARALDPLCEPTLRLLLQLYKLANADAKAKEVEDLLSDEAKSAARKAEMDDRKKKRPDGRDGCK